MDSQTVIEQHGGLIPTLQMCLDEVQYRIDTLIRETWNIEKRRPLTEMEKDAAWLNMMGHIHDRDMYRAALANAPLLMQQMKSFAAIESSDGWTIN